MKSLQVQMACVLPVIICCIGCATANPVVSFYQDLTDSAPLEELDRLCEPVNPIPRVVATSEIGREYDELHQRGYIALGASMFTWAGTPSNKQLTAHAKKVGADIALYTSEYSHTETGIHEKLGVIPGTSTTTTTPSINSMIVPGLTPENIIAMRQLELEEQELRRESEERVGKSQMPQIYTYSVPYSVRVNKYQVLFMRKARLPILGVGTSRLPDDARTRLHRNTGALVRAVGQDSPAYKANIMRDDIIIAVAGMSVDSPKDLDRVLRQFAGQQITVRIIREGQELDIPVSLNLPPD